ncbi:hypothetical protein HU755_23835 [Pseudomonas sp. SWRI111]|uniref:hypothetical protein n=2 Tax=unclassified Pseudomonas TaxID=196821 RepID=UPI00164894DD|nr:hypothetical protein [Pseudomonas sp. SWRI111]MBC3209842.1 hypothetical protein [Pseudomonas sp. SWRI111]
MQRIILCINTLLLAACVTQPKNTDRQAVLLAQPLTPNSLMREGEVINFQVIEPRDPQSVMVQRFQYSAACNTAQIKVCGVWQAAIASRLTLTVDLR